MDIWTFIGMGALGLIAMAVVVPLQKHRIPVIAPLEADDAIPGLRVLIKTHAEELGKLGFRYCGMCAFNPDGKTKEQMAVFLHSGGESEFSIRMTRARTGLESHFFEFASSLAPHGRLELGAMEMGGSVDSPPDIFITRMAWDKTVETFYRAHLEHLGVLAQTGFIARPMSEENAATRLSDRWVHLYETQVKRGRMTRREDGSYRQALSMNLVPVVLQGLMAMNPLGFAMGGNRTAAGRALALRRAAGIAQQMPADWRLNPERV